MEQKFKVGDIVVLKSGGPIMTVDKLEKTRPLKGQAEYNGRVQWVWFNGNTQTFQSFNQDALEIAEKK
jgi:uncharacterized protein YodC (DUF2158 family)